MRIVCPSCDTAYDAPESVVASGKPMRCARCRSEWVPGATPVEPPAPAPAPSAESAPGSVVNMPESVPDEPSPPLEPEPEPEFILSAELPPTEAEPVILAPFPDPLPKPEGPKKTVVAAWAASVLVLAAAFWLAIAFRQPIMRDWPASARAYAAIGIR